MTETNGVNVVLETEFGNIVVALDTARAPRTAENFLFYVDGGFYDGGKFHRTVTAENNANTNLKSEKIGKGIEAPVDERKLPNDQIAIQVIQGGINPDRSDEQRGPLALERTSETGLKHLDGTISMARFTPDSAVSDFFICIGDTPELDFGGKRNPDGQGFAAFGQVIEGLDVVRTIQLQPANGQALDPVVPIVRASRASA
ncbi:MAG TPA: peptidylprolyl isomerase [Thermomicrobiales bacterium]|nr:peptidylprolyl isomerase [Thermomicrobiales bacterium]